ncbi:hypothetical protein COV61_02640, partial [Candidatus Micrarchaeota archaeon CG11_big_fil_rev_8_21_14_0_20_47_5]
DGTDLKLEFEKGAGEISEISVKAPSRATFPLQYLEDIVKASPDLGEIVVHLKSNAPLKIEYSVEGAKVSYYLAPRIDSD